MSTCESSTRPHVIWIAITLLLHANPSYVRMSDLPVHPSEPVAAQLGQSGLAAREQRDRQAGRPAPNDGAVNSQTQPHVSPDPLVLLNTSHVPWPLHSRSRQPGLAVAMAARRDAPPTA